MRSTWVTQEEPKSNNKCPDKTEDKRHRPRGEGHMKTEAETVVLSYQACGNWLWQP